MTVATRAKMQSNQVYFDLDSFDGLLMCSSVSGDQLLQAVAGFCS